jgi:mevalonate kinase
MASPPRPTPSQTKPSSPSSRTSSSKSTKSRPFKPRRRFCTYTCTVRSALPISAGLGSSAAFSVAVASSLLYTHGILPLPPSPSPANASTIDPAHSKTVNAWSFLSEKVIHGTPSGVDNTVATLGGAIAFTKAVKGREGKLEVIKVEEGKEYRFLLTDTKVPRDTKTLVEGVARRKLHVRLPLFSLSVSFAY